MNKNLYKAISAAVVLISTVVLMQSCAMNALPVGEMKFNPSSEKGLLIGSVTFPNDKAAALYGYYFFRLTNNTSQEVHIDRTKPGELDNGRTYLFAIERPVGKSEIPSVRLANGRIGGFSIPYEIKKGEVTYLGNILFNDHAKKGDVIVAYKNSFERDVQQLKKCILQLIGVPLLMILKEKLSTTIRKLDCKEK